MQSSVVLLPFLLAAVECSYVAQQRQPLCRQVPKEVCTDTQVPQTNYVTERQCSAVPTTRQECSTKQEQQCDLQPDTKCFNEPKTIKDIQQVQECQTITDRQCNTLLEQQCQTITDRQCNTLLEQQCHTEFDTKQECVTTTEEQCDTVPDTVLMMSRQEVS